MEALWFSDQELNQEFKVLRFSFSFCKDSLYSEVPNLQQGPYSDHYCHLSQVQQALEPPKHMHFITVNTCGYLIAMPLNVVYN